MRHHSAEVGPGRISILPRRGARGRCSRQYRMSHGARSSDVERSCPPSGHSFAPGFRPMLCKAVHPGVRSFLQTCMALDALNLNDSPDPPVVGSGGVQPTPDNGTHASMESSNLRQSQQQQGHRSPSLERGIMQQETLHHQDEATTPNETPIFPARNDPHQHAEEQASAERDGL
jgi:hypothetical protein